MRRIGARAVLGNELVVIDTAMEDEGDGLLVAIGNGLAGRLIGSDSDERHLTRSSDGRFGIEEGKEDFLDDAEDGLACADRRWRGLPRPPNPDSHMWRVFIACPRRAPMGGAECPWVRRRTVRPDVRLSDQLPSVTAPAERGSRRASS